METFHCPWQSDPHSDHVFHFTGGRDDSGYPDTILRYNPSNDTWTEAGQLTEPKRDHASTTVVVPNIRYKGTKHTWLSLSKSVTTKTSSREKSQEIKAQPALMISDQLVKQLTKQHSGFLSRMMQLKHARIKQ